MAQQVGGSNPLNHPKQIGGKMYFKTVGDTYKLKDNLRKLDEISKFEKNWNGYDADPVPEFLIEETRSILKGLGDLPQPFLAPFASGDGIQIEWEEKDGRYLEIDIKASSEKDQPNKYDAYTCLQPQDRHDPRFFFSLEGTVEKDQECINNLVRLFYGKPILSM